MASMLSTFRATLAPAPGGRRNCLKRLMKRGGRKVALEAAHAKLLGGAPSSLSTIRKEARQDLLRRFILDPKRLMSMATSHGA